MSISGMGYVRPVYAAGQSVGSQISANVTATTASIPTVSDGNKARYCLLAAVSTAVHVRVNGSTATVNDLLIGTTPIAVLTKGASQIAHVSDAGAGAKFNISPLEDA